MRVLLVDEEPGVRLLVGKHLSRCGWRVDKVMDGQEALAASSNVAYDAVVLDQGLPGRSGIEVAHELDPDLPVVLFTSSLDPDVRGAAADAGCRIVAKDDLDGLVAAIAAIADAEDGPAGR